MQISEAIREVLCRRGTTQAWVIAHMNLIDPSIQMNRNKFSNIVRGTRKMTGDELLIFCKATNTDPDVFFDIATSDESQEQE